MLLLKTYLTSLLILIKTIKNTLSWEIFISILDHSNRIQRSIKYQGVNIWNSILQTIKKFLKTSFKIKLKLLLLHFHDTIKF